ncbi:alpha/beta fold hydrolase [Phycicoccus sp. CSK15P-2]|uniref:alpha/beta hydrolase n=1 Tax=Phycicoccus sp. CSK15P-2 TaxID=2807627 RepID=UPI00194FD3CE|nr:alpha/beta hydrolase [Phycicoccus sp. CSK15P-2]MBM6405528.1 alpha/beta fold hydrolase [Phycicoccus sp. CSK15P-2]
MTRRLSRIPVAVAACATAATTALPATAHEEGTTTTGATAAASTRYLRQTLDWQLCDEATGTECALVTAPRDWNRPGAGEDIRVAVSRTVPEGAGDDARYIFGNPGGPGAPGLGMAPYLASVVPDHIAIGFDVRGTGASTNVSCEGAPQYTMDARDRDRANLDLIADASKLYDPFCTLKSRGLRDHVTTEQTVKDVDLVRALLGAETFDYVGYSGGTWLGAYYQKYFPKHAGRFVLDSNTDFTRPWNVTFEAQPESFERRFRQDFTAWAAEHDDVLGLGSSPEQVRRFYERLRADLKRDPIEVVVPGEVEITLDQNFLDADTIQSMYSKYSFQPLAADYALLRTWWDEEHASDPASVQRRFDATPRQVQERLRDIAARMEHGVAQPVASDAYPATFYAITCNDTRWPRGQRYLDRLSGRLGPRYPLVGWSTNENPCAYWTRPGVRMPVPDGAGVDTTLMVQSVNDPATNARLARDAERRYSGAVLLTVTDEGDHGVFGMGNRCVDDIVLRYLTTGRAPAHDRTCRGIPVPDPVPADGGRWAGLPTPQLQRIAELSERLGSAIG